MIPACCAVCPDRAVEQRVVELEEGEPAVLVALCHACSRMLDDG